MGVLSQTTPSDPTNLNLVKVIIAHQTMSWNFFLCANHIHCTVFDNVFSVELKVDSHSWWAPVSWQQYRHHLFVKTAVYHITEEDNNWNKT